MIKKMIAAIMAMFMIFTFVGCNNAYPTIPDTSNITLGEDSNVSSDTENTTASSSDEHSSSTTSSDTSSTAEQQETTSTTSSKTTNDKTSSTEKPKENKTENQTTSSAQKDPTNEQKPPVTSAPTEETNPSEEVKPAPPEKEETKPTRPAPQDPSAIEQEVLDIMNRYRAEEGLAPLSFNRELYYCAKVRTEETMIQWSHTRPDGRRYITVLTDNGFKDTGWHGENAAKNFKDAESMVKALMESEGHRKNIMFPKYESVALCVMKNEHGLYQMVQIFEG